MLFRSRSVARVFYAEPLVFKTPRIAVSSFSWVMDRMYEAGILERDTQIDQKLKQKQKLYRFSSGFEQKSWGFVDKAYCKYWLNWSKSKEMKFGEGKKPIFGRKWLY